MNPGYGLDGHNLICFLLVFVRVSALLLASPVFGAQTTPVQVRIMTTLAISAALSSVVQPKMGAVPTDLWGLAIAVFMEAVSGVLIGAFMSMALQVAQIAGGIMDMQVGLSSSQILNPISGVSSTVLAQFKFMLGVVVFLCMDGHHLILRALVHSYSAAPTFTGASMEILKTSVVTLLTSVCLLAIQIAAPVMGVSMVIDAALGLINRAVPTFQAMVIGLPAKIAMGLVAVAIGLPAVAIGVNSATGQAMKSLAPLWSNQR